MVRLKQRYLLFNIFYPNLPPTATASDKAVPYIVQFAAPSPARLTPQALAVLIRDAVSQNFGDWGGSIASSLSIKYFSPATSTGIIRIAREHYRIVWAALTYLREVNGQEAVFKVLKVSGTIKKAELGAIEAAQKMIERAKESEGGASLTNLTATGSIWDKTQFHGIRMELDVEDGRADERDTGDDDDQDS